MVLLKTKYIQIEYHNDVPCIYNRLLSAMSGKAFRVACEQVLELYRQLKKHHLELYGLMDVGSVATLSPEDQVWLLNEWQPRMYRAGLRNLALVVPGISEGKKSGDQLLDSASQEVHVFETTEQAKAWLLSVKNQKSKRHLFMK